MFDPTIYDSAIYETPAAPGTLISIVRLTGSYSPTVRLVGSQGGSSTE